MDVVEEAAHMALGALALTALLALVVYPPLGACGAGEPSAFTAFTARAALERSRRWWRLRCLREKLHLDDGAGFTEHVYFIVA